MAKAKKEVSDVQEIYFYNASGRVLRLPDSTGKVTTVSINDKVVGEYWRKFYPLILEVK